MGVSQVKQPKNRAKRKCLGLPRFNKEEREAFDKLLQDLYTGKDFEVTRGVIASFYSNNPDEFQKLQKGTILELETAVNKIRNSRRGCGYDFERQVCMLPEIGMWKLKCPECGNLVTFIKGHIPADQEDKSVWERPYWF